MMTFFEKILYISLSSLGFSLVFLARRDRLFFTALGGTMTGCASFFISDYSDDIFIINLVSAFIATAYSEIMARLLKAPATVFLLPSIMPLVPGGLLYYSMSCLVNNDREGFSYYAHSTLLTALGIAVGIIIISVLVYHFNRYRQFIRHNRR